MPILIIAFNRPELLTKLIKSIEKFKPKKYTLLVMVLEMEIN